MNHNGAKEELNPPHMYYLLLRLVQDYRNLETLNEKPGRDKNTLDREADLILQAIEK